MKKSSLIVATALVASLAGLSASAQNLTISDENRKEIEQIVLQTLTENPQILVDALNEINKQQLEARAALEAQKQLIREIAANEIGAPVTGNPDGNLTIVVFSDYNCQHCKSAFPVLEDIVKADGNIRVVHREFPLLGPDSAYTARAALAADMQGKYEGFSKGLMTLDSSEVANMDVVLKVALETGVDLNRMLLDLDSPQIKTQMEDTKAVAEKLKIVGTPTFLIGTEIAAGTPTTGQLKAAIDKARGLPVSEESAPVATETTTEDPSAEDAAPEQPVDPQN